MGDLRIQEKEGPLPHGPRSSLPRNVKLVPTSAPSFHPTFTLLHFVICRARRSVRCAFRSRSFSTVHIPLFAHLRQPSPGTSPWPRSQISLSKWLLRCCRFVFPTLFIFTQSFFPLLSITISYFLFIDCLLALLASFSARPSNMRRHCPGSRTMSF